MGTLTLKAYATDTSIFTYPLHKAYWVIYKCSEQLSISFYI